jgi:hypothetical protein
MQPSVQAVGVEDYLPFAFFARHFDHINYVDRHRSSN